MEMKQIHLRVTEDQKQRLSEASLRAGLSLKGYVLERLFGKQDRDRIDGMAVEFGKLDNRLEAVEAAIRRFEEMLNQ
jgi:hypothetical protein